LCKAKILLSPGKSDGTFEVNAMNSHKATKFLTAAAAAVVLIATVAVAHTLHTHSVAADQGRTGKIIDTTPAPMAPAARHGIIVCGMALDSDCEKLETMLPM
jgi:hypothetical protein